MHLAMHYSFLKLSMMVKYNIQEFQEGEKSNYEKQSLVCIQILIYYILRQRYVREVRQTMHCSTIGLWLGSH